MIKTAYTVAFLLLAAPLSAQVKVFKFWVELSDKKDCGYSIDKPEEFLSPRAIERRAKQNIRITEEDLPVTKAYKDGISATGAEVLFPSRWFNALCIKTTDSSLVKKIAALPYVKSVRLMYHRLEYPGSEPKNNAAMMEFLMSAGAKSRPEESSVYGFGFNQINMLNGIPLHEDGFRGEGMVIAVLDAGFYKVNEISTFNHLREDGRLLGTFDFVTMDTIVYEDDMHGMNVLSCMASNTPGKMIGTAPKASYWLIRTEDNHSETPVEEASWVAGAEFADSVGADLINSSLGYTRFDDSSMSYTYRHLDGSSLISRAAKNCARRGIIVCNAAGNEGSDSWRYIGVPADADSILSVGGVDKDRMHVPFSSYGPTADGRIKPTLCAKALETTVASSKDKFYPSQGTSFASPVMCGMVACLWQANPQRGNMEIINALIKSADQFASPDNQYGYGIPDMVMANRILGGDKAFDYSVSRWLEEIPSHYDSRGILLKYYAAESQEVKILVRDGKGRKIRTLSFALGKNEFLIYPLKDLPVSKKGISLEIQTGEKQQTYRLDFQN
jgi:serine protease AprX